MSPANLRAGARGEKGAQTDCQVLYKPPQRYGPVPARYEAHSSDSSVSCLFLGHESGLAIAHHLGCGPSLRFRAKAGVGEQWSIGFQTQHSRTPALHCRISLDAGERGLERREVPEVLHLQILALQRAGETVELQVVLRRASQPAVIRKDAVLDGFLEER
jgi:hypothetical protein